MLSAPEESIFPNAAYRAPKPKNDNQRGKMAPMQTPNQVSETTKSGIAPMGKLQNQKNVTANEPASTANPQNNVQQKKEDTQYGKYKNEQQQIVQNSNQPSTSQNNTKSITAQVAGAFVQWGDKKKWTKEEIEQGKLTLPCHKCKEIGHWVEDCPWIQASACHKCERTDHFIADCTYKPSCAKCGTEGACESYRPKSNNTDGKEHS